MIPSLTYRQFVFVGAVVAISGCSDIVQDASPFAEQQARCDLRPDQPQCTDLRKFKGPSLFTFQGVCGSLKVAYSGANGYLEGATCSTEDMWGGCRVDNMDGSQQTNWYYKSDKYKTEEDAKKECESSMTWTAPE